ncbi:MAG: hypothetical protein H7326_06000, partial [Bdellovibrionaceae bacterium]|nr:hypothetical protein [Pseudobdellovibrionaceae bacterium]
MGIRRNLFTYFLFAWIGLTALPADLHAQAFLAEMSFSLWNKSCEARPRDAAPAICLAGSPSQQQIHLLKKDFGKISEQSFLGALANERAIAMACAETQIDAIQVTPKATEKFVDDYVSKLTLLAYAKKQMTTLEPAIAVDKKAAIEYHRLRLHVESITSSMSFIKLKSMNQMRNYITSQSDMFGPKGVPNYFHEQMKEAVRSALKKSSIEVAKNKSILEQGALTNGESLDENYRESLAQDEDLIEGFRKSNPQIESTMTSAQCRVDAKYGRGAESRDNTMLAISVLATGGAAAISKIAASGLMSSLTGATAIGTLTPRTAGILRVIAATTSSSLALRQSYRACYGDVGPATATPKIPQKGKTCDADVMSTIVNDNCLLTVALSGLEVADSTKVYKETIHGLNKAGFFKPRKNLQLELWKLEEEGSEKALAFKKDLQHRLQNGKVYSSAVIGEMNTAVNNPELVTFEDGLQGVWKRKEGIGSGNSEIAAYLVDSKIKSNLVPITVPYKKDGVDGTIQLFVSAEEAKLKDFPSELKFIDYLLENGDRHGGNYLISNGRLVAIDNGISFGNEYH